MRTSQPPITGRRVLALVVAALILGAASVGLDAGNGAPVSAGLDAAPTSAAR